MQQTRGFQSLKKFQTFLPNDHKIQKKTSHLTHHLEFPSSPVEISTGLLLR